MTRSVSLGMYDFPWLAAATDALWRHIRARLLEAGVADVPAGLDRARSLQAMWSDPALLLAQTCGYPLMTDLAGQVQVVATPAYDLPGCDGVRHCSFVVVRDDEPAGSLAAFRGRRCAINGRDSNTGMNLLRAMIAPLAGGRAFFSAVIETGAHLDSLLAVREGRADLAAIDSVTHGLVARHRPGLLRGSRILAVSAATPGLPFVTAPATTPAELAALRAALADAAHGPAALALGLSDIVPAELSVYAPVIALEQAAKAAGYPTLA